MRSDLRSSFMLAGLLAVAGPCASADDASSETAALERAVEQLRHAHGGWEVQTRFLNPDGSVARTVPGTYDFRWVVPDRVLAGESHLPELKQSSAILFYVQASKQLITMSSVGADGHLWVMSGPAGDEVRTTPPTPMSDGTSMQLRFTRSHVTPDSFESRMEYSSDGGKTWTAGNHQTFRRRGS